VEFDSVRTLSLVVCFFVIGCSDSSKATLKGQLFTAPGQKLTLAENEQAFLSFVKLNDAGQLDPNFNFPCMVKPDGEYEMVASGGELPPGQYRVSLEVQITKSVNKQGTPKMVDRFNGKLSRDRSNVKVEVKPGANDLPVDLHIDTTK